MCHDLISTYFTSGSRKFLISLENILAKNGLSGGSLVEKERGFDLKYSVKDSLILYELMYNNKSDAALCLTRKRRIFEKYMRLRS